MFEKRVAVVLAVVVLAAAGLLARAAQVQIGQTQQWQTLAAEAMRRSELTEAPRGRILDRRGRVLAQDVPCNDAAVAYWWVDGSYENVTANTPGVAKTRLYLDVARPIARASVADYFALPRRDQHAAVLAALPAAKARIEAMWDTLAAVGGMTRADIEETRKQVVQRVEARRRQVAMSRFNQATRGDDGPLPWWRRWLLGESSEPPELDQFENPIAEELSGHTVLADLSTDAYNELRQRLDALPGLELRASSARRYPGGPAVAHVVGHVGRVDRQIMDDDPEAGDESRAYLPRDLAGKAGLERMAERELRGGRGRIDHHAGVELSDGGRAEPTRQTVSDPAPGEDVRSTIDLELQREITAAFENVRFRWPDQKDGRGYEWDQGFAPGAAVVIDVRTGQTLAMVSAPGFHPDDYNRRFDELGADDLNRPLTNRATSFALEPGSTVKPAIGLGAVAEGLCGTHETILCDGFLHFGGRTYRYLRCWTASLSGNAAWAERHQGGRDPHPTIGLNLGWPPEPGQMTLADAIQRSCNVYFETLAGRLGESGVNHWLGRFGLGRPTGIGLPEDAGNLPRDMSAADRGNAERVKERVFEAGIGQGNVKATPIQIANLAATLARGGVAIRPTLVTGDSDGAVRQADDLGLDPAALASVHRGMRAVVRTPGGSGSDVDELLPLEIAAKTGTAQAAPLPVPRRTPEGDYVRGEDGRVVYDRPALATRDGVDRPVPWYRRSNDPAEAEATMSHSWFVGYAPAENPTVAFAVFVEYGGSGGRGAGSVVPALIESLVRNGYLEATREPDPSAPPGERRYLTGPRWP